MLQSKVTPVVFTVISQFKFYNSLFYIIGVNLISFILSKYKYQILIYTGIQNKFVYNYDHDDTGM